MIFGYYKVISGILLVLLVAGSASAQSDPYGTIDLVYIDSVEAGPGRDIQVRVCVRNDETLESLSLPITYEPSILALKEISFTGSRAEHIQTKILQPAKIDSIDGHFVVAIIRILEDPIPAGDGVMFTALFTISDSARPGTVTCIDSLFYPPGGEMLLVESENSSLIHPAFQAGKVAIRGVNRAPVFAIPADQYVMEGDTLLLDISVSDPDNDDITLAVTSKPAGATFVDYGDGSARLTWVPDFVGPNSSDGSPFVVSLWASDGDLSVSGEVAIRVVNRNRAPVIHAPGEVVVAAGSQLQFSLSAFDPDFESITWAWSSELPGATFDSGNPGHFTWGSALTDTGSSAIEFVATDPHGFADSTTVSVMITPVAIYALNLDTVSAFPGENVSFNVYLNNMLPVTGFNVLFHYDPSVLSIVDLTNEGTRSESFEYFSITYDDNGTAGDVRLVGVADQGGGTPPLEAGEGPIASLTFRVTGDLAFAGMTVPVRFKFLVSPANDDNTLTDSLGIRIEQEDITYCDGSVSILEIGEVNIGDINLNGLAAEISDVIYFTNFFIDPGLYSFNVLQYANSDVNQDGFVATVSDLVALINLVVGGVTHKAPVTDGLHATVFTETVGGSTVFVYKTDFDVGGLYVAIETDDVLDEGSIVNLSDGMDLGFRQDGRAFRLIMYSLQGRTTPVGRHELFSVDGITRFRITDVDLATADGRYVSVTMDKANSGLPERFVLHQNCPNPFNPRTSISFDLPRPGRAQLTVYNILGRRVNRLLDEEISAGTHSVVWDGRDDKGQAVASGIYFYRLETAGESLSRKMMFLK